MFFFFFLIIFNRYNLIIQCKKKIYTYILIISDKSQWFRKENVSAERLVVFFESESFVIRNYIRLDAFQFVAGTLNRLPVYY